MAKLQEVFGSSYRVQHPWKFSSLIITFVFIICSSVVIEADEFYCSTDTDCRNNQTCQRNICVCPDGWQGSGSQHCTSKIGFQTKLDSTCSDKFNCNETCSGWTTGKNCEKCKSGYWGDPINGGTCNKCECNGQASDCDMDTGKCFCHMKGLIGDHCDVCDSRNMYLGDPSKEPCYHPLVTNYMYTFNLSKKSDLHYDQINFRNSPEAQGVDADLNITCSRPAKMNITVLNGNTPVRTVFSAINCSSSRKYHFSSSEYLFGTENNESTTTFDVSVYDFKTPLYIQISFTQYWWQVSGFMHKLLHRN